MAKITVSGKYFKAMKKVGKVERAEEENVFFVSEKVVDFLKTTSVPFAIIETPSKIQQKACPAPSQNKAGQNGGGRGRLPRDRRSKP